MKKSRCRDYFQNVVLAYTGDECLIWPFARNADGRARIQHDGRYCTVSRIVCEFEHGAPPTPRHQAAHNCGNGHGGCVSRRHLAWKTTLENAADKVLHGTVSRGESHGMSKLSESQVFEVLSMKGHFSQRKIAARYGVDQGTIKAIHNGKTWGWLSKAGASMDANF
jgi:hypothetical protein